MSWEMYISIPLFLCPSPGCGNKPSFNSKCVNSVSKLAIWEEFLHCCVADPEDEVKEIFQ